MHYEWTNKPCNCLTNLVDDRALKTDHSHLDIDLSKAVMQGGGVAQQQLSSVLSGLVEEGINEACSTDKPESLPTTRRQGEVALSDPAQSHSWAVRSHTWQRVRPQPQDEVWGRLGGWSGNFRLDWGRRKFWSFTFRITRKWRWCGSLLGALLPELDSAF